MLRAVLDTNLRLGQYGSVQIVDDADFLDILTH